MNDVELIPYDDKYRDSLFEFTGRCFAELDKAFEPEGRHWFYNDIGREFDVFYCLMESGRVIGSAGLKKISDDTAELKALYLDAGYRGRGYGRQMMDRIIADAGELGYETVRLDSMSKYKDALRLYERTGFTVTDRFNDNPYADVFMKLELNK